MENIFGKNLRRIRESKNLTLKQLAEKLNITFQSVEKWEKGATMPNGKRLIELVEVLNISQNDLYRVENTVEDNQELYVMGEPMVKIPQSELLFLLAQSRELTEIKAKELEHEKAINMRGVTP